jgi:dTMP kinase
LKRLKQEGHEVIYTREPGGSRIAETIRNILLDVDNKELTARTEALLYAASRSQHLQEIVIPALQAGKIVLCDRYVDSSLAYQGVARDLGIEDVWKINEFAIDGYMPQKTLFFAVSIETGQKRMNIRGDKNRLDLEQDSFHQKVRRGYEALIKMYPERIQVIDAEPALDVVVQAAYDVVKKVIEEYE